MAAPAMAESRLLLPVKNRVLPAASLLLPLWGAALDIKARPVVRRREGSILLFGLYQGQKTSREVGIEFSTEIRLG